ncbi:MAG: HNH endonuclease, partial [Microcystis aeruginosa]
RTRFGDCCAYCRTAEFLTAMTFEFEHIRPLAAAGETVFENLCFPVHLVIVIRAIARLLSIQKVKK